MAGILIFLKYLLANGLSADTGTIGYFKDLKVKKE
jgi:hypothetical protein